MNKKGPRFIVGYLFIAAGGACIIFGLTYFLSNPQLGGYLALDRGGTIAFIGSFVFLIGFGLVMYNTKPTYMEPSRNPPPQDQRAPE